MLVTDYSSVIFENAILNNPLVLYAPDLEEYDGERGFYFEYVFNTFGNLGRIFYKRMIFYNDCPIITKLI